jgi:hypothetical protein
VRITRSGWFAAASIIFLAGCDGDAHHPTDVRLPAPREIGGAPRRVWLPRVPIPIGDPVDAVPSPYDPSTDSRARASTPPRDTLVGPAVPLSLPLPRARPLFTKGVATYAPGSGDRGWFLYQSAEKTAGLYQVNDAQLDLVIPDAAVRTAPGQMVLIYAPTALSPGGACLEMTTRHQRTSMTRGTEHHHGFWDWCTDRGNPSPGSNRTAWAVPPEDMTSAFWQNNYMRYNSTNGDYEFVTQVYSESPEHSLGSCWDGLLYNYLKARWDLKARACGVTRLEWGSDVGWTMWESYNWPVSECPPIPGIKAWSILSRGQDGVWYDMAINGGIGRLESAQDNCFARGPYSFESPVPGLGMNAWSAHLPGL